MTKIGEVPTQLKTDIGFFYVSSMSGDPTRKISGTRNLCTGLRTAFHIAGASEYYDLIEKCIADANLALYQYSVEMDWGHSSTTCSRVVDELTQFVYDSRWCIPSEGAFAFASSTPEKGGKV